MRRVARIEVGQRFRSLGVTGQVTGFYEVAAVFRSRVDRLDYARVVDVSDRSRAKIFGVGALVSPRHFLPLPPLDYQPRQDRRDPDTRAAGRLALRWLRLS